MQDSLVEIARHLSSHEAWLARNRLAEADIAACLDGEAMAVWGWIYGSAIGGVKLLIRAQDVDRARDVLSQPASHIFDGFDEDEDADLAEQASEAGRPDMAHDLWRAWWASVFALASFPPVFTTCSVLLLLRHNFAERPSGNWRVVATIFVNLFVLSLFAVFLTQMGVELLRQSPRSSPIFPNPVQQQR